MISNVDHIVARGAARAAEKSSELLRRAADAGDNEAAFALGVSYLLGCGAATNYREALMLLNRAVDAGIEDAPYFRQLAEEQIRYDADENFKRGEAAVEELLDAKRREMFPRPKLVVSDK